MEFTYYGIFLLPAGLGLLGFVEPCTIGGHLLFLASQNNKTSAAKATSLAIFVLARLLVMGGVGGLIVFAGQLLVEAQTTAWLVFGVLYMAIGAAIILGRGARLRRGIKISPQSWRTARHPALLGAAFGLNVPACAAPILFGLIGLATAGNSVVAGFVMMAVFALALSLPLIPLTVIPRLADRVAQMADWLRARRWITGSVFVLLGIWAVWFGLFVDPVDWSRL